MFFSAPLVDNHDLSYHLLHVVILFLKLIDSFASEEKTSPVITVCLIKWNGHFLWLVLLIRLDLLAAPHIHDDVLMTWVIIHAAAISQTELDNVKNKTGSVVTSFWIY